MIFDPHGEWLLSVGGDHGGFYTFYNLKDYKVIKQEKAKMHIHDVCFNTDGTELITCGHHKMVTYNFTG